MPQGLVNAHETRQTLVEALRPGPRAQLFGHHPGRLLWPASADGGTIGAEGQAWGRACVELGAACQAPRQASGLFTSARAATTQRSDIGAWADQYGPAPGPFMSQGVVILVHR